MAEELAVLRHLPAERLGAELTMSAAHQHAPSGPSDPPSCFTISSSGHGGLKKALESLRPNSVVVLAPGEYRELETLEIKQSGITFMADQGQEGEVIITAHHSDLKGQPMMRVSGAKVSMIGIKFKHVFETSGEEGPKVQEEVCDTTIFVEGNSELVMKKCSIMCPKGKGLEVAGKAKPRIEECEISQCVVGVCLHGKAAPVMKNCHIFDCQASCVHARGHAAGLFDGNKMHAGGDACICAAGTTSTCFTNNVIGETKGCGVLLGDRTRITLERNNITAKHINGIQAGSEANPTVRGNVIKGSGGSGIVLHDKATGIFVGNTVEQSKLACIGVRDSAEPYFRGNTVSNGEGSGIVFLGSSGGVFEDNQISGNGCSGIKLNGTSHVLFDGNKVQRNKTYGIWLMDDSKGSFQNNVIEGNTKAGLFVGDRASPDFVGNTVREGKQVGIILRNSATGMYKNNVISKHETNVLLHGSCGGYFEGNQICYSSGCGVLCRAESTVTLIRNTVDHNVRANIAVLDRASPIVEENVIQEGSGRGLVITGHASGRFVNNIIRAHGLAGVYVGGHAEPYMSRNTIAESGASGIVVEDSARGTFSQNSILDNVSAAVAVQGSSSPRMERNVVKHNGHGGIWLGEHAGGVFEGNDVEASPFSWRIGTEVTAKVSTTCKTAGFDAEEPTLPRIEGKFVLIQNPGTMRGECIGSCKRKDATFDQQG
eukprot:CAMPEP_0184310368 /NCGR_PEP_ID=MMETSP1049-20130417/27843_1 /TAXON_ID=77928 /ORGANISM="Proteomonas sulcata, Strain CCMP704" /LENGTH=711 /DNA_ID=CAMNT_0026624377 /DNA_START=56 /DNA_END=2191 /DNA_ORIENTATION=-